MNNIQIRFITLLKKSFELERRTIRAMLLSAEFQQLDKEIQDYYLDTHNKLTELINAAQNFLSKH